MTRMTFHFEGASVFQLSVTAEVQVVAVNQMTFRPFSSCGYNHQHTPRETAQRSDTSEHFS